jgi:hypothetical protein
VFDQYIDTVPDDFSYTYNADNLTASVTGFADPDHITHMDANRLYIPDTVINSDDGQTYTITGISNGAFNVVLSDYSPNKQGLAYNLLIDNGTIKFIRYPFGLSNIGVRTFGLNYRGAAQPKYSSIKGSFIPSGTFTVAQEGLSISYSIIYISQGLNLPTRSSQYLSQFRDIEPNHLR